MIGEHEPHKNCELKTNDWGTRTPHCEKTVNAKLMIGEHEPHKNCELKTNDWGTRTSQKL